MSETARGDLAENTALRKVTKRVPLGQADHEFRRLRAFVKEPRPPGLPLMVHDFLIETAGEGGCFHDAHCASR